MVLAEVETTLRGVGETLPQMRTGMLPYLEGGKRLRARLLVGIGTQGPLADLAALRRYATFVELVHAGGLCHDDVVDRSPLRRGQPSIGHLYGVRAAASGGLYLMARAFECVAEEPQTVRRFVADAAARVARGQAREMTDLYRDDVSIDEYLVRASDKTAALFELAARLGALAGGFDLGEQARMASYGAHVGLAFQLADDLRDIVGGPGLGRERGTDIREGVYTLPVLIALTERRRGHEHLRRAMHQARLDRDQATVDGCCEILMTNGSVATAARVMCRNVELARAASEEMVGALRVLLDTFVGGVAYGLDDVLEGPA